MSCGPKFQSRCHPRSRILTKKTPLYVRKSTRSFQKTDNVLPGSLQHSSRKSTAFFQEIYSSSVASIRILRLLEAQKLAHSWESWGLVYSFRVVQLSLALRALATGVELRSHAFPGIPPLFSSLHLKSSDRNCKSPSSFIVVDSSYALEAIAVRIKILLENHHFFWP